MASLRRIPISKNIADLNPFLILVSNKTKKAGPSKKLNKNPKIIPLNTMVIYKICQKKIRLKVDGFYKF